MKSFSSFITRSFSLVFSLVRQATSSWHSLLSWVFSPVAPCWSSLAEPACQQAVSFLPLGLLSRMWFLSQSQSDKCVKTRSHTSFFLVKLVALFFYAGLQHVPLTPDQLQRLLQAHYVFLQRLVLLYRRDDRIKTPLSIL
jgi:hypothetical protein